jgi:hypothetical protein
MASNETIPLSSQGADQTATASPLSTWAENYTISLETLQDRRAPFPTLQSFSAGMTRSGEWVLIGGRTNGLHNFTNKGIENFPPAHQNDRIWVYDPVRDRSWSRPLSKSGLSSAKQLSLSTTNAEQLQQGDVLFRVGGYVYNEASKSFQTRNRLSAIDLGNLASWAKGKRKQLLPNSVLSVAGEAIQVDGEATHLFAVTGGELLAGRRDGQAQLIFGQDFKGGYTQGTNGLYTSQVRNFNIQYQPKQGELSYSLNRVTESNPSFYRRRDLNVMTQLHRTAKGKLVQEGAALAGVFYNGEGVWTVPVKIDLLTGQPIMPNPENPATFRQGFNQYTAANLGLYSRSEDSQTNLIFGGISALILDPSGETYYVNPDNDPNQGFSYPFTSQIAALSRTADGEWTQSIPGSFPNISNDKGQPLSFGASSTFIPLSKGQNGRVRYLADGVLDLDRLQSKSQPGEPILVGYVVGGIESQVYSDFNDLSTYGNTNYTVASGEIFQVLITPN